MDKIRAEFEKRTNLIELVQWSDYFGSYVPKKACDGQIATAINEQYDAFYDGYEAAKASQWISVADKLPENGVWVLISVFSEMAGRVVSSMAFYEVNDDGEEFWTSHNDNKDDEWEGVTHWQPLP